MTAARCVVRPFAANDAEAVAGMIFALNEGEGYDPKLGPDAAALPTVYLGPSATGRCLVAEDESGLVGYVALHTTYETTHASRGFYVADLYVAPAARRRGIGRALLAAAARLARSEGGGHLWWTALPGNAGAHGFYRALGCRDEALRAFVLADAAFDRLARGVP